MKNFKLKKGISTVYPITNEKDFYDLTGGRRPYMETGKDGKKRAFGICPGCDNPIQIVGLYNPVKNTDKPYRGLHGIAINAAQIPDMVPALAVTAAFAEGETVISHAERLHL